MVVRRWYPSLPLDNRGNFHRSKKTKKWLLTRHIFRRLDQSKNKARLTTKNSMSVTQTVLKTITSYILLYLLDLDEVI